jgi:cytidylate kinase
MKEYITISREYGCKGRQIGLLVAEHFGVTLYDRDIIRQTSKISGLSYEYIREEGEKISMTDSIVRLITPMLYEEKDTLFDMQKDIILAFAKGGPCVFLGRCADQILDAAGMEAFNVFLYASDYYRMQSVAEKMGKEPGDEAYKEMRKVDGQRIAYYSRFSGRKWGDYKNFDLMLDVTDLSVEAAAKIIIDAYELRENK